METLGTVMVLGVVGYIAVVIVYNLYAILEAEW